MGDTPEIEETQKPKVKLTKKGLPDRRSETSRENIKKAIEARKLMLQSSGGKKMTVQRKKPSTKPSKEEESDSGSSSDEEIELIARRKDSERSRDDNIALTMFDRKLTDMDSKLTKAIEALEVTNKRVKKYKSRIKPPSAPSVETLPAKEVEPQKKTPPPGHSKDDLQERISRIKLG